MFCGYSYAIRAIVTGAELYALPVPLNPLMTPETPEISENAGDAIVPTLFVVVFNTFDMFVLI